MYIDKRVGVVIFPRGKQKNKEKQNKMSTTEERIDGF